MKHRSSLIGMAALLLASIGTMGRAQQPGAALAPPLPAVGDLAPDFAIRGATRYGLLHPTRLSDYRGQTVVLALFVKARTRG
jgi:hypothetical protein